MEGDDIGMGGDCLVVLDLAQLAVVFERVIRRLDDALHRVLAWCRSAHLVFTKEDGATGAGAQDLDQEDLVIVNGASDEIGNNGVVVRHG